MSNFFDDDYKPKQRKLPQATSVEGVHRSVTWHMYESDKAFFLTEAEMRVRLERKTDNQEWIDEAIQRLKNIGDLKTDQQFTQQYIEQSYFGDYGAGRVYDVLIKKLIPRQVILEELATYQKEKNIDEREIVTNYAQSYYPSFEKTSKESLVRVLTKRGFKHEDVEHAIKEHHDYSNLKTKMQIKAEKTDVAAEIKKGERKNKGLRAIKAALQAKKVDVSNIEKIADELARNDEIDFYERGKDYLAIYVNKKRLDISDYNDKSKAYGHLNQRGYSSEEIKFAFEELQRSDE